MKPKLWDGPSAVAEARDRFNRIIDTPYQTASGPGFRADKKNGFHEVHLDAPEPPELEDPRWLCYGVEDAILYEQEGPLMIRGSGKHTRRFKNVRTYGLSYGINPRFPAGGIAYIGGGRVMAIRLPEVEGGVVEILTSTNGKRWRREFLFYATGSLGFQGNFFRYVYGTTRKGASFTWGAVIQNADPITFGNYLYYEEGEWYVGNTLRYLYYNCSAPNVKRLGPTTLFSVTGVYPTDTQPTVPLPFFSISYNNGATWTFIAANALFSDLYITSVGQWGNSVYEFVSSMICLPVSPTKALMIARFTTGLNVKEYRQYEITNISSGVTPTITHVSTFAKPAYDPMLGSFSSDETLAGTGVVVMKWVPADKPVGGDYFDTNNKLVYSKDRGATWLARDFPFPSPRIGYPAWLDKQSLLCPMYDTTTGEHAIYETKDLGLHWDKRGVISKHGMVPSGNYDNELFVFDALNHVRWNRDKPADVTAGAPWITNSLAAYSAGPYVEVPYA